MVHHLVRVEEASILKVQVNLRSSVFSARQIEQHAGSSSDTATTGDRATMQTKTKAQTLAKPRSQAAPRASSAQPSAGAKVKAEGSGKDEQGLPIGELVKRSGVAASTLRFYEDAGLMRSTRSDSGRRHYARSDLRRLAFVRAAQSVGLSLEQIRAALAELPEGRTPTVADWTRLSSSWRPVLDERIAELCRLRDRLSSCIGCGCLSLRKCALYNPGDQAGEQGAGARFLLQADTAAPQAQVRPSNAAAKAKRARARP